MSVARNARPPRADSPDRDRPSRRSRRNGCVSSLALGLALGITLPLVGLVWLQAVDDIGPAPLLIAYASLPWLIPIATVLVVALALFSRTIWVWFLGLVLAAVFLFRYGGVWWPKPAVEVVGGRPLRVMTFNIGDGRVSAQDVMAWVRTEDPDLLVIEELNFDTAPALNQGLAAGWPNQALDFSSPTTGLFSRYTLNGAEFEPTTDIRALVDRTNRADLWLAAAKTLGVAGVPASDTRGVETFFDGVTFDPADPQAYLRALKIKRAQV